MVANYVRLDAHFRLGTDVDAPAYNIHWISTGARFTPRSSVIFTFREFIDFS